MTLKNLLKQKKSTITEKWLEASFNAYPSDASVFFIREKNQFANPVGQTHAQGINAIFDALVEEKDSETLGSDLDLVIKIRAVQEFSPSKAISFIFLLKDIVKKELKGEIGDPSVAKDLAELFSRIDDMALLAFDIYTKYRDKIFELRVNDIKRRVAQILKQSKFFDSDLDSTPDQQLGSDSCRYPQRGGGR